MRLPDGAARLESTANHSDVVSEYHGFVMVAWFEDFGSVELALCVFAAVLLIRDDLVAGFRFVAIQIRAWWG